jgi:plastocyanin
MDRVCGYTLAMLLFSIHVWAGTVLLPPPPVRAPQAEEGFPESRFGFAPAPSDDSALRGDRRPAGLVFDSATAAETPPAASVASAPSAASANDASSGQRSSDLDSIVANRKGVQEIALIASDLGYFPKTVFLTRDIPVRMFVTGASKNTLCIMMDSFQVRKQIRSQKIEEITFTPNMPGKYRFYCPVNGMEGTLIVKELASNP